MAGYLFRKVEFPALVETDTVVIGVRNDNHFNRVAKKHSFDLKRHYVAVDSTGEEWWYFPERDSFTPLTLINDWSNKKLSLSTTSPFKAALLGKPMSQDHSRTKNEHGLLKKSLNCQTPDQNASRRPRYNNDVFQDSFSRLGEKRESHGHNNNAP